MNNTECEIIKAKLITDLNTSISLFEKFKEDETLLLSDPVESRKLIINAINALRAQVDIVIYTPQEQE